MSHLIPFSISGYDFTHVSQGDDLYDLAMKYWNESHDLATQAWRDENYISCENEDRFLPFAIHDPSGEFYGTWALYRIRAIDENPDYITALPAPMFPEIETNSPEIEATFWIRCFAIMEFMTEHALPYDDGGELVVEHFRFPRAEDGDPTQHEWAGKRECFDRHCKLEVFFDEKGAATRTGSFKSIDPCPERERGSFGA